MNRFLLAAAVVGLPAVAVHRVQAAISYLTAGSTYSEHFDSLPANTESNANLESGATPPNEDYAEGWQDDVDFITSPQDDISVPGWHLRHPISPSTENGFNGFQRYRQGAGANAGAFYGFATPDASESEKALGSIGTTTVAANNAFMYMGLQLVNNTGTTLRSFTLTYDGEQYRDGQGTAGETLVFEYSLDATDANWFTQPGTTPPNFVAVPALNFTAPVVAGTSPAGTAVNGNVTGRVNNLTATVSNIVWANGAELWLRWGDVQLQTLADDGLAIDDIEFSAAVPEPMSMAALALGAIAMVRRRRMG
jgi:hypothetical protein